MEVQVSLYWLLSQVLVESTLEHAGHQEQNFDLKPLAQLYSVLLGLFVQLASQGTCLAWPVQGKESV